MTPAPAPTGTRPGDELAAHRRLLWRIAYRMLGSASDADDVLQEVALRWLAADAATVHQPRAWLIAVCSRLCIDQIRRAKRQRDAYPGPWLPEPVADDRADDLSLGYLLLLQRLKTSERTVLVLHEAVGMTHGEIGAVLGRSPEACRQSLSRAKRRVAEAGVAANLQPVARERVTAFRAALLAGDHHQLVALLADDAVLLSDGGGKAVSALRPILTADRIARFLAGIWRKRGATLTAVEVGVNGAAGLLLRGIDGRLFGLLLPEAETDKPVGRVLVLRNPDKLRAFA
jgi:RNA polymerase sigma-70 factor, ECF subfamily